VQLRQSARLKLPNAFAGHANRLPNLLKRFWLTAIQPKTLQQNLLLSIIKAEQRGFEVNLQIAIA
jgi:hypothetical protein